MTGQWVERVWTRWLRLRHPACYCRGSGAAHPTEVPLTLPSPPGLLSPSSCDGLIRQTAALMLMGWGKWSFGKREETKMRHKKWVVVSRAFLENGDTQVRIFKKNHLPFVTVWSVCKVTHFVQWFISFLVFTWELKFKLNMPPLFFLVAKNFILYLSFGKNVSSTFSLIWMQSSIVWFFHPC